MKKLLAALCLLPLGVGSLDAAKVYDGYPDLTNLSASCVDPYASGVGNVIVEGRHTVITKQGTDPRTGGQLKLLPEGFDRVVKLGNELAGTENESLTYCFRPSYEKPLLRVKFAVVFENPDHLLAQQPYFSISITDSVGKPLAQKATYEVYAREDLVDNGFKEYVEGSSIVLWRDWSEVAVDLSQYIGKEVHLTFKTRDCLQNGHYAYAYYTATYSENKMEMESCDGGDDVILSLVDGYLSYLWSDKTTTKTYKGSLKNGQVYCDVTTVHGNNNRVYVQIGDKNKPTPEVVNDKVCEGAPYNWNGVDIDTRFSGTRSISAIEVDTTTCSVESKMLVLTTTPAYTYFSATICEGESYNANGFNIKNPPVGILNDTIKVAPVGGCDHWNVLSLKVVPRNISPVIVGDSDPCTQTHKTYAVNGDFECEWTLPANATSESGLKGTSVEVLFKNTDPGVISVTCNNGCASKSVSMNLKPVLTIRTYVVDTICQGDVYNKNGWDLGVQKKAGFSTHIKQLGDSCGSSEILTLFVMEAPTIQIEAEEVVCKGTQLTMKVVNPEEEANNYVAVGDIICTDDSIISFAEYLKYKKTAKAVVFMVDTSGHHGYAVALTDALGGREIAFDRATTADQYGVANHVVMKQLMFMSHFINYELQKISGPTPVSPVSGSYWTRNRYNDTDNFYTTTNRYEGVHEEMVGYFYAPLNTKFKIRTVYSF